MGNKLCKSRRGRSMLEEKTEVDETVSSTLCDPRRQYATLGLQLGLSSALGHLGTTPYVTGILVVSNVAHGVAVAWLNGVTQESLAILAATSIGSYTGMQALSNWIPLRLLQLGAGSVAVTGPIELFVDHLSPRLSVMASRAMVLEDMPTIQQQKYVLACIVGWVAADWHGWVAFYVFRLSTSTIVNLFPLKTANAANAILSPDGGVSMETFTPIIAMVLGRYVLESGAKMILQEARTRFVNRVKVQMTDRALQQEMAFFEATTPTWFVQNINTCNSMSDIPAVLVPTILNSFLTVGTAFQVLSRFDMTLAAMCILSVPLNLALGYAYSQYVQRMSLQKQRTRARMSEAVHEMIYNAKTCRLFDAVDQKMQDYRDESDEMVALVRSNVRVTAAASLLDTVMPSMLSMLMFGYSAALVRSGRMNMTDMMMVGMYQQNLTGAFNSIPQVITAYGSVMGDNRKVFQLLQRQSRAQPRGDYIPPKLEGRIEFRNVSFTYRLRKRHNKKEDSQEETVARKERIRLQKLERRAQNVDGRFEDPLEDLDEYDDAWIETKVLEGFSLTIQPGEKVALVGRSGSGKTTVANLLLGLYDAGEGEVLVDGEPVYNYKPEWFYTEAVGVVSQTPSLLNLSVKDNLLLGVQHKEFTDDDLVAACTKAAAHDFIAQLPEGYNTAVGKAGGNLSGGQRQRVAIARVLLRNPSILVLDEATSALDAKAEHLVQEALHKATEGRTVLMIAHRLSTIQTADRIVVMDSGQIVEQGTHSQLLELNGLYASLVQKQLFEGSNEPAAAEETALPPAGA